MSDIHALIRGFLQQQTIIPLADTPPLPREDYTKSGVVPFTREDGFRFQVMKPRGNVPSLGRPLFQLCKGTRQHHIKGAGWRDIKPHTMDASDKETLAETALREGIEELGLKLDNIAQLFEMGGFEFSSATTGKAKHMWLFAAEVRDEDDVLPDRDVALTTATRRWLSVGEFAVEGRDDHRYILRAIADKLAQHFKE